MHRYSPDILDVDSSLIDQLMRAATAEDVELIETHISWVLLRGDFVYKIKKPVYLGFLDFRDLDRRRFYCEEEIRLNKPFAPDIYLDVVPLTNVDGKVEFSGTGTPVEYAVRMRRFDQAMRLDAQLESGNLTTADMLELAEVIAQRHYSAQVVDRLERTRTVRRAIELIQENFEPLEGAIGRRLFDELQRWTYKEIENTKTTFGRRFDTDFFRECHGDLHLANLVRLPTGIATFDCIEFSAELRNTDVMADVTFLVMDLAARGELRLAAHFLNRYLEVTGDYGGMRVFNLYFTYRCLVRAKVAVIRSKERQAADDCRRDLDEAESYCELAHRQTRNRRPVLVAMNGFSGSGKTWVSELLMDALPGIRVRSDIERKRVFDLTETADSGSGVASGIYTREASARIYDRLNTIAGQLLKAGHNAILDASFLKLPEREAARRVAERSEAGFSLVQVVADNALLRRRLDTRARQHSDASEAGERILDYQLTHSDALTDDELLHTIQVHSEGFKAANVAELIRQSA